MAKRNVRRRAAWITLLTDFGWSDGYVAAMRGVIASVAPRARVVDAAHDLPPGDVRVAAWVLSQYWLWWPRGTIHVAVVDPGVGTDRAAVAAQADGRLLLAPDNGLLTGVAAQARQFRAWRLGAGAERPGGVSATFHGRDVFAYAAARIASGVPLRRLVDRAMEIRRLPDWAARRYADGRVRGIVVRVDRFGNAITTLGPSDLPTGPWEARVGPCRFRQLSRTYNDVAVGRPLLYLGSTGRLEVGVRDGAAAERLRLRAGDPVFVRPGPRSSSRPSCRQRFGGTA